MPKVETKTPGVAPGYEGEIRVFFVDRVSLEIVTKFKLGEARTRLFVFRNGRWISLEKDPALFNKKPGAQ